MTKRQTLCRARCRASCTTRAQYNGSAKMAGSLQVPRQLYYTRAAQRKRYNGGVATHTHLATTDSRQCTLWSRDYDIVPTRVGAHLPMILYPSCIIHVSYRSFCAMTTDK